MPVGNPPPTSSLRARSFAIQAHGQQRYGDQPYCVHLDAVAALLELYGTEATTIGYLHDVVEDTTVAADRIQAEFGERVACCVQLVTDEPGANRPERKARTNAKLAGVSAEWHLALIVKAADRLANLRVSARGGIGSKLDMYRREHASFRAAVFRPGLCNEFWMEMERLLLLPLSEV